MPKFKHVSFLLIPLSFVGLARADSVNGAFSIFSGNPNGAWTYGWESSLGGTLTNYNQVENDASYLGWNSGSLIPAAWITATGADETIGSVFTPLGWVNQHPGSAGQFSVLRYTIPLSGTYDISGTYQGDDTSGATTDVHDLWNSDIASPLFSSNVSGYLNQQPFSVSHAFIAGDTLDFVVGVGGDGNYPFDSTGVQGTITLNPVPEPATRPLIVIGLLMGLGSWRVSRRRRAGRLA